MSHQNEEDPVEPAKPVPLKQQMLLVRKEPVSTVDMIAHLRTSNPPSFNQEDIEIRPRRKTQTKKPKAATRAIFWDSGGSSDEDGLEEFFAGRSGANRGKDTEESTDKGDDLENESANEMAQNRSRRTTSTRNRKPRQNIHDNGHRETKRKFTDAQDAQDGTGGQDREIGEGDTKKRVKVKN